MTAFKATPGQDELLSLAAVSERCLTDVERDLSPPRSYAKRLEQQLARWHQQLDETRLQAALAEMELRDVRNAVIGTLEDRSR